MRSTLRHLGISSLSSSVKCLTIKSAVLSTFFLRVLSFIASNSADFWLPKISVRLAAPLELGRDLQFLTAWFERQNIVMIDCVWEDWSAESKEWKSRNYYSFLHDWWLRIKSTATNKTVVDSSHVFSVMIVINKISFHSPEFASVGRRAPGNSDVFKLAAFYRNPCKLWGVRPAIICPQLVFFGKISSSE